MSAPSSGTGLVLADGQALVPRPGAGGNIAADVAAKSAPDGYTLLLSNVAIAIAPSYYPKLNYDPVKDLVPVTELDMAPHVLCVNTASASLKIMASAVLFERHPLARTVR